MSENTKSTLPDDEFDVEVMVEKLYSIFKKAVTKIFYPVRVVFSSTQKLILALILAAAMAGILKVVLPPVYQTTFIIKPQRTDDLTFVNLFWDIISMISNSDYVALASELKLDENTAQSIKSIAMVPVWKSPPRKDTVSMAIVEIRTFNPNVFDTVQAHLLKYLETNAHYTRYRKLREHDIAAMKTKLQNDLKEIDSLKHRLAQNATPRGAGGFVYGEPLDPVKTYDAAMALYKQELSLNWQTEYMNNFELVKPCIATKVPVWPKFWQLLAGCFGAAFIALFFINSRKML